MDWKELIRENTRFGLLEMLMLFLLSEKEEMSGQQIKIAINKRTKQSFSVEENS